jgi:hypothetical protein
MANYFARANGNINATNVWATTPSGTPSDVWSTFNNTDVLHANNFAITVNVSTTVATVRNDNANGATAGGSFTLNNGVTLTANVVTGTATCVTYAGVSGNSATLTGNVSGSTTAGVTAVSNTSSGTLNINGNITGGSVNPAVGVLNNFSGVITITGNVTGGSAVNSRGITNNSTGTVNITGNVTGGSASTTEGVSNGSIGTVTITGNVTGGTSASTFGAINALTGTLTIVGSAIASNNSVGANNASTGILNVTRAVGNGWGIGTTGIISVAGVVSSVAGSQTRVDEFEFGSLGQAPVTGAVSCPDKTTNVFLVHRLGTTKKTLFDPSASTGMPDQSNVRHGTVYALGNRTGTLRIPAVGSVALGVAVDNTVGTAVLTQSAVWDALVSGMTTSGSIGARLKNAATIESTGQQLADALSPVP